MKKYIIILAGGAGTRLWPASRAAYPKQFLEFDTGISLYQRTLKRALRLKDFEAIIVVTHKDHVAGIGSQSKEILDRATPQREVHILPEPVGKNTAPAIAYACAYLNSVDQTQSELVVLPADHLIEPLTAFQSDVKKALALAASDFLVTFGVPPKKPDTGYGYIKAGKPIQGGYYALEFTEKPDKIRARSFLEQGNYYWNSGMFTFKQELFMQELMRYNGGIIKPLSAIDFTFPPRKDRNLTILPLQTTIEKAYAKIQKISVDHALLEKSKKRAMVKASFNWSDVGSWDEVALKFKVTRGKQFSTESKNNYVFSDLPVALVGVENLNVIVKNNIVLISKQGSSQLVKKTVDHIEAKGFKELL
ncbi:MAG: mannose-1-phosphate guanylyltransferase [Spirochaetales bacterium]|nr:mannose-1-phosphate guanylyltransferase [Spirochaetales bacterium]